MAQVRDEPARVELIHESERSRVSRVFLPGRSVIRKEPLGPDAQRHLARELAVLDRLRGAAGVTQLLEVPEYQGSIVLADAGTATAAARGVPFAIDVLVPFATALARAVAEIHRRGVIHRDITPANVVITRDGAPCLVGFGSATAAAEIRPEFTHHTQIVGTLAYLAPEQTGRTARPVDQRADLYALGATLYELATGEPPFGSGDPLRLTHDHLARVPVAPAELNPALPAPLSEIVMHLLEKEPDNRYQTAEGVIHDLERLLERPAGGAVRVGEHDVPLRLPPPSRLVGRDAEVAALEAAFAAAMSGTCRGMLVGGAAGVGKTALVDELRRAVTSADGWFVAGKFDPYRRDRDFDAVQQSLRALGRLLLAEPEAELAQVRAQILRAVDANAALLTATVPELATLLAVPPDAGDPLTAQARAQRTASQVLRVVASRKRPLVVFVDDLQWAGRTPLGAVDLMLSEEPVDGLLLVVAYRDDIDAADPLTASLSRWRHQTGVTHLRLANLPRADVVTMVAEMLHTDRPTAAGLVDAIEPHTRGNPYQLVEMLNALRRDGALSATVAGWRWDEAAVRARLARSEAAGPAVTGLDAMPPPARQMLEVMACLGGRAELSQLQIVTEEPVGVVEKVLAPALDEGLLVLETGSQRAFRFRHDRAREGILRELDPERRRTLHLEAARRLAAVPELFAVAAEQYLPVAGAVTRPAERRAVVGLLLRAADQAALIGDYELVNALAAAAQRLVDPTDAATVTETLTRRHAALFSLGRLDDADAAYGGIEELCPTALERADATAVQVRSLSHRTRFAEAIELGLQSLRECGIDVPADDEFAVGLDDKFERLYRWLDSTDPADELARRELADPGLLATSRLIDAVLPAAYFVANPPLIAWLATEAVRIWIEHGPSRILVGSAGHAAYQAGPQRGEYPEAYRALRRIVALGEARGYEPGTSQARHMAATMTGWFEPIENGVHTAHQAREGLIGGGELVYVGYTYQVSVPYSMDCAPTLASLAAEIDDGLAFLRRTGNEQTGRWLDSYQWLARALRSESSSTGGEAVSLDLYAGDPTALIYAHLCRAIAAAIFGDAAGLAQHSAAAMELLPAVHGFYAVVQIRLLHGLAVAEAARAIDGDARDDLLAELDDLTRWLAGWAEHAPDNFLHQLRLIEAERAWSVGDFRAAVLAFDAARRDVADRGRPWHRALIAELAAQFHLAHGLEHAGHELLAQARHDYLAWGATAKVDQIDWAHPPVRRRADAGDGGAEPADLAHHRSTVTTGTIDLLGILSASQALSSETSVERLHARVVEVLGAITGATRVHLLLWSDDGHDWLPPVPAGGDVDEPAVPMSVLRYVQRTREPLVVADATGDDRFARDPYFSDGGSCSLLAVPILRRGSLKAVLVLENRLIRGAFSSERLDAVKLIAGQLAISLDNTQLYAELASSRARVVAAGDQVRRRIGQDLHDGAQQRLVHTILTLKLAQKALRDGGHAAEFVAEALENAERGFQETRELAHGLHPRMLSSGGLAVALDALARRSGIPVRLDVRTDARLPERVEVTAYYVVSEALTNAAKHSNASGVEVSVAASDGEFRLSVSDDGVGGADLTRGSGLVGLKDRVEAIGGTLAIQSRPGEGTRLALRVPIG